MYQSRKDFTAQVKIAMTEYGIVVCKKTPIFIDTVLPKYSHSTDALRYMVNYQNNPQEDFGTCVFNETKPRDYSVKFDPDFKLPDLRGKYITGSLAELEMEYLINLSRPVLDNSHHDLYLERKNQTCSHDMEKKFLLTSHYMQCKKCGFES